MIAAPVAAVAKKAWLKLLDRRVLRAGHYCEHTGFVALAAAETFSLHALVWYVSVILLVSGVFALLYDKVDGI